LSHHAPAADYRRPLAGAGDEQVVVISQDTADTNRINVGDTIRLDLGNG
jgi:hypothetical protein